MSRAPLRSRLALAAAAVAAGAAVAAPAASAATVPVAGGVTNLHLDAATAGVLTDAGLAVAPVGPAKAAGLRIGFPVTGGAIDPATGAGTVTHSGGLAFSAHGTTVRLTSFTVQTAAKTPVLTAAVGKTRIPLLAIDTSKATVIRRGPGGVGTWVVRVETTLRPEAAAALNAAFGTHLPGGVRIGRVDVRTQPSQVLLDGGATTLALDPGTAAALTSLGVTPSVIAPGTASAAGLAFPITGGRLAAGTFAGTIPHSGGIALSAGRTRVELKDFIIGVDSAPTLSAQVGDGPARVDLDLDLSAARTGISKRTAVVRGVKVSLSGAAAAALNQAFGTTALKAGLPLGTADVRGDVR